MLLLSRIFLAKSAKMFIIRQLQLCTTCFKSLREAKKPEKIDTNWNFKFEQTEKFVTFLELSAL